MKLNLLIVTSLMAFSGMASAAPGIGDTLAARLAPGVHNGISLQGDVCQVNVQQRATDAITISVTPDTFDFDKEEGSSECMYTKACFSASLNTKVIDWKELANETRVSVKRASGGPDRASAKTMTLSLKSDSRGVLVSVDESVGLFGMGSTKANCFIAR